MTSDFSSKRPALLVALERASSQTSRLLQRLAVLAQRFRTVHLLLPWLVVSALASGCDSAESARVDEARTRLVGTWLREAEDGSVKARRILVLAADGKFTDHVLTTTAGEAPERRELAGEWSFDGTNLKRKYLRENGRQFSGGSMRYATFPLVSVTQTDLVVKDTIQGRDTGFRRVPEGTRP